MPILDKSTSAILAGITAISVPFVFRHRATMIASNVTQARTTLLMRLKFLMMQCGFVGRDDVPSFGTNEECDQVKSGEALELEEFSWSDLPADLVRLIISKLVGYEDKAKLACVCKSWKGIIRTMPRLYPAGKSPLLIHIKSRGGQGQGAFIQYYSPWLNKAFEARSPLDLTEYEIISAKDGGLLMYNQDTMRMKLADPFNGHSLEFPRIRSNISFNGTAIGLFRGSYAIFLIDTSHENQVTVHLYDGLVGWALDLVYDIGSEPFHVSSNPVYFDGRFYCLGSSKGDRLGVFDLLQRTWNLYRVRFMNKYHDDDVGIRCCYLVDWIDTVMMVLQVNNYRRGIHLFRLDSKEMVWKETDDLCGRSLFLGSIFSGMSLHAAKKLQNRVFLPDCHQDEPKRVTVAEPFFHHDQFCFKSKPCISCKECCCNNSGEDSLYFGSTQNHKNCTMWFQPSYMVFKDK